MKRGNCRSLEGRRTKLRLLSLALLAFLVQATLPFFLTDCPLYKSVQNSVSLSSGATLQIAMASMGDCPMMPMHQAQMPAQKSAGDPHKKQIGYCALCDATCALHGYVAAGLVSLPPPVAASLPVFQPTSISITPQILAAAFSARGPPSLI